MSTRNWEANPPKEGELWARASQTLSGHFGVSFGLGSQKMGFVLESVLGDLIAQLERDGNTNQAELVKEAAAALPAFKAGVAQKRARRSGAAGNN